MARNKSTTTATSTREKRDEAKAEVAEATGAVRQASSRLKEQQATWLASLSDDERSLLDDHKVPEWTIKFHSRMGHLGGAALFAIGSIVFWPVLAVTVWQMLVVFGTRIVNEVPSLVLTELGVNSTTVATRTDSFVFSWVMPVLFFVLILAGVSLIVLRWLVKLSASYSKRLALGLFAGYGTGLRTDFTAVSIARSQRKSAAKKKRETIEAGKAALDKHEDDN